MKTLAWVGSQVGPTFTSEKLTQDYDFSSGPIEVDDGDALELVRLVGRDLRDITELEALGGGSAIPSSVVGAWGEMIGSSKTPITPDATTGKALSYIKLTRTAIGAGDIMGDGAGGVAMSINSSNVVSVTDGANTATITVTDFDAVDKQVILVVELDGVNEMMRLREIKP